MKFSYSDALNNFQNGKINEAKEICEEILKSEPNNFNAYYLLGVIAFQTKNYIKSDDLISKAIEINPKNSEFYNFKGIALIHINKFEEAIESWTKAIEIDPNSLDAYNNRGNALIKLKKNKLALKNFDQALKLKPNFSQALHNRSVVLKNLNKFEVALESVNKAIEINPKYVDAYNLKGVILRELNQIENSLNSYDKAIKLNPNFADAHLNRGNLLLNENKQLNLALESFTKALKINPNLNFLFGKYIHTKAWLSNWDFIDEEISSLKDKITSGMKTATPFPILSLIDLPDLQKKNAENYVKNEYSLSSNLEPIIKRPSNKKIRIGYYSADFNNHPTSFLMVQLLELHDRSNFEIFCFSLANRKDDEMRKRVSNSCDKFLDVSLKSDEEIARISRDLNIDIACDVMGFTKGNKFQIFAEKCAPIQVSYLAFPGTTGANFIDYVIADKTVISQELKKYYSEKIIFLPDTYQVNDSAKKISDKVFTREEMGLPKDSFVFCCFNKNYKILPRVFDIWMNLLKKVKGSVLWLLVENSKARENLKKEATKRNIDENRIIFAKIMPLNDHLARHRCADLFIDTFPYTAHTTCSDALWAGLPVVTRIGKSFASRVSASLLNAIDLPELITHSEEEFENLALDFANNKNKLNQVKVKLEKNKISNSLFNTKLYTKNIESSYKIIYDRYLKDLPVEDVEI
mgnify:FL=1